MGGVRNIRDGRGGLVRERKRETINARKGIDQRLDIARFLINLNIAVYRV